MTTTTLSAESVFEAPLDKVWATVVDFSNVPKWNTIHVAFPDGNPAKLQPDDKFSQKVTNMRIPYEIAWTVHQVKPPALLELHGKAPLNISIRVRYELSEDDAGTHFTMKNEFSGALVKMMTDRLLKAGKDDLDASVAKFKQVVE